MRETLQNVCIQFQACWVIHCFSEVKFKNAANLNKGLDMLRIALCTDKELPVRVEAAIAIQMVLAEQEKGKLTYPLYL